VNCPKCHAALDVPEHCAECGWKRKPLLKPAAGPDYARIAAEREASIARAFEPCRRPLACQSTLCPPNSRSIPGRDLCASCAAKEDSGGQIARIRKPKWSSTEREMLDDAA
jgi:hypothetical protein